jgi:hypothetical protein
MKKIFLMAMGLLAATMLAAAPIHPDEARAVARNAFAMHCMELGMPAKMTVPTDLLSREVTLHGIDNLYVFNIYGTDGKGMEGLGFVVVSGDDIAAPVLAFSTDEVLPESGLKEKNPAVYSHLQRYGLQIAAAKKAGIASTPAIQQKWADLKSGEALATTRALMAAKGDYLDDNIPRLLGNMRWGQNEPYNDHCPGGSVTGCVATAFGMIMNYWDYPQHGFGMHAYNGADNPAAYPDWSYGVQYADFEHTYYDWEHMDDYAVINSPTEVKEAISTLIYQIGVSLDMRYSPTASGCWSLPEYAMFDTSLHLYDKAYTLGADYRIPRHFGYKYSYAGMRDSIGNDSLWLTMLYHSLAEGKPIYYAGWAAADNEAGHSGTSGHGYIIEGYFSDAIDTNFFYINWGWNGSANGFFKLDAMRPSNNDFTQWHGAIIGIEPDTSYHGYDYTGIRPLVVDGATVSGHNGYLSVRNVQGRRIAVYDVTGRLVTATISHDSEWRLSLRPGFYAVRVGSDPAKKVIVY